MCTEYEYDSGVVHTPIPNPIPIPNPNPDQAQFEHTYTSGGYNKEEWSRLYSHG